MIDLAPRPTGGLCSDSDDDRLSYTTSATSPTSEPWVEPPLPSSLRKLLNPILPPSPPSPTKSEARDTFPVPPIRRCLAKEDGQASCDLSRFRPWKRLPPPRPLNPQSSETLSQLHYCLPTSRRSPWASRPCSSANTQFNPYYLPALHLNRERQYTRVSHKQCLSEDRVAWNATDAPVCSRLITSFSGSPITGRNIDIKTQTKPRLNTYSEALPTARSERLVGTRKANNSREKERNRCLTCGSSFSTFANLTRHEKKCPLATTRTK